MSDHDILTIGLHVGIILAVIAVSAQLVHVINVQRSIGKMLMLIWDKQLEINSNVRHNKDSKSKN